MRRVVLATIWPTIIRGTAGEFVVDAFWCNIFDPLSKRPTDVCRAALSHVYLARKCMPPVLFSWLVLVYRCSLPPAPNSFFQGALGVLDTA